MDRETGSLRAENKGGVDAAVYANAGVSGFQRAEVFGPKLIRWAIKGIEKQLRDQRNSGTSIDEDAWAMEEKLNDLKRQKSNPVRVELQEKAAADARARSKLYTHGANWDPTKMKVKKKLGKPGLSERVRTSPITSTRRSVGRSPRLPPAVAFRLGPRRRAARAAPASRAARLTCWNQAGAGTKARTGTNAGNSGDGC